MAAKTATGRCGWNTGTVWTGPRRCSKTSKAHTDHPYTDNGEVCGIHARAAASSRHAPIGVTYTITPHDQTGE